MSVFWCAQAREQMRVQPQSRSEAGAFEGLRMLARSRLFMKLTACVMLTGIVMEGMYELLGQYFQLKLHYTTADQASLPCNALMGGLSCHGA